MAFAPDAALLDLPAPARAVAPEAIFAEQVRLLYRLSLIGYLATLLVALGLGAALWDDLTHPYVFAWLATISTVTVGRYLLYKLYIRRPRSAASAPLWQTWFVTGSLLMGLSWAFMGTVLLPADNVFYQMTVLLMVSLLCTGAVAEYAPSRPAFLCYVVPALFPLGINLLLMGGRNQVLLGAIICLLGMIIMYIHEKANEAVLDSLTTRFEAMGLANNLNRAEEEVKFTHEALLHEVAERRRAEAAERQAAQRLRLHVEQTPFGVIEWDLDFRVRAWNAAAEKIFGYTRKMVIGERVLDLIVSHGDRERMRQEWNQVVRSKGGSSGKQRNMRSNGSDIICEWYTTPLLDSDNRVISIAALVQDVTERSMNEDMIHHLAHHDALTGLPNRRLLEDRLEQAIAQAARHQRSVGVLYIDLDRFKLINDTLGHAAGDLVLRTIAQRLEMCVRPGDTVSREGGDEFVVALPDLVTPDDARPITALIKEQLSLPHSFEGQEFHITPSIGVSFYPGDADSAAALLKHADSAMYDAKDQGRNTVRTYTAGLDSALTERLTLETNLRRGLERNEFTLQYQPQVQLDAGIITAVEGLLRWTEGASGEEVNPDQFIPVAEEMGVIAPLGDWVLRTACLQHRAWQAAGLGGFRISVNLSARQFLARSLLDEIKRTLVDTGVDPQGLELEITESMIMRNPEHAEEILRELRDMGITLAIDDFGTGHSSLSHLKRFPVQTLKIDPLFVAGIPNEKDDAAIILAILAMARSLRLRVVAEGVETVEQLRFLRDNGCDAIQGYLFSRPLDGMDLEALVRSGKRLDVSAFGLGRS